MKKVFQGGGSDQLDQKMLKGHLRRGLRSEEVTIGYTNVENNW